MALKTKKYNNITWINIVEPDASDLQHIAEKYKFHLLDIKDVKGEAQRSKIDVYLNYAFIVLQFPVTYKDSYILGSHELDIFLGKDYIITIQKKKLKSLNQFFYKVGNNKKLLAEIFSRQAAYILYHILENQYRSSFGIIDWLSKEINRLEQEVYDENPKRAVKELAQLRRNVLSYKSLIDPQRFVAQTLATVKKDYLSGDLENYFDDILDYIQRIYSALLNDKELIDGLHETNESLATFRLNRVMKILTIFSVSMLPLTLLTGLYGMNLETLPLIHNEQLVWYIFGGLVALIVIIFIWLKKKDII